jgi:hypothetical protein
VQSYGPTLELYVKCVLKDLYGYFPFISPLWAHAA